MSSREITEIVRKIQSEGHEGDNLRSAAMGELPPDHPLWVAIRETDGDLIVSHPDLYNGDCNVNMQLCMGDNLREDQLFDLINSGWYSMHWLHYSQRAGRCPKFFDALIRKAIAAPVDPSVGYHPKHSRAFNSWQEKTDFINGMFFECHPSVWDSTVLAAAEHLIEVRRMFRAGVGGVTCDAGGYSDTPSCDHGLPWRYLVPRFDWAEEYFLCGPRGDLVTVRGLTLSDEALAFLEEESPRMRHHYDEERRIQSENHRAHEEKRLSKEDRSKTSLGDLIGRLTDDDGDHSGLLQDLINQRDEHGDKIVVAWPKYGRGDWIEPCRPGRIDSVDLNDISLKFYYPHGDGIFETVKAFRDCYQDPEKIIEHLVPFLDISGQREDW